MSDSYPGPGHWRQSGEQSALMSNSPFDGQVVQAATKTIDRKKESEIRYMVPSSNHDSTARGDLDYGRFWKRALFNRSILRLRTDTSRIEAR